MIATVIYVRTITTKSAYTQKKIGQSRAVKDDGIESLHRKKELHTLHHPPALSLSQQCLPPRGRCVFETLGITTINFLAYQLQHNQAQSRAANDDEI